ncbi:MAG TPA: electron transfer flavoprotein subunit beta/FixA family protein [Dehalococcoidia bacterium]|nr:electron transfer flavoprotein subunit beta/FixA family protein [Dehalococcoidia bacterium]
MDIVACIKRIPDTSEADMIKIDASQTGIERGSLVFKINDWDEYVLETAVQLKERTDGSLTAVTVGPKEWDDVLRRALAMGADRAIRVDQDMVAADCHSVGAVLTALIKTLTYDLVLFGAQSEDFGCGQLGVMVAEMLGIPHAALVVGLQEGEEKIRVDRELEAGLLESYTIELPALLTIQTGINRPRYISLGGIKRAMRKELQVVSLGELGLTSKMLAPQLKLDRLEFPPMGKEAVLISGSAEESAERLASILQNAGIF